MKVFCRYWCLKEAFVKAIGSGLAFDLDKVEFRHSGWTNISVNVEGKAIREWRFWLLQLGKNHLVGSFLFFCLLSFHFDLDFW